MKMRRKRGDPGLRIGILIVGSLIWDPELGRLRWRAKRLLTEESLAVSVPIRYGRLSEKRNWTYTMVFSRLCMRADHGMGTGKAVPCRQRVLTVGDLVSEAEKLWLAECKGRSRHGRVSGTLGSVGLLVNPRATVPPPLLEGWAKFVGQEPMYGRVSSSHSERFTTS
jgi:hypothetical protein